MMKKIICLLLLIPNIVLASTNVTNINWWDWFPLDPVKTPVVERIIRGNLSVVDAGWEDGSCKGEVTIDRGEKMEMNLFTGRVFLISTDENNGDDTFFNGYISIVDDVLSMTLNWEHGYEDAGQPENPHVELVARNKNENWQFFYQGYVDTVNCNVHLTVQYDNRYPR